MSKPKLALIPSGYKSGKVYSILPNDGTGDFDFERQSIGTRVRKDGLIEEAKTSGSITNIQLYSEQFDNSVWSKVNASITANDTLAPNGTNTADKLTATASSLSTYVYEQHNLSTSTTYTMSVFVKKGTSNLVRLDLEDFTSGTQGRMTFNLNTKEVTQVIGEARYEELSNGWFRLIVSFTTSATLGIHYLRIWDYETVNNANFYLWGAMLNEGALSDYIKTEGTTETKTVETFTDVPRLDWLNSNCPTLNLEPQRTNDTTYSEDYTQTSYWNNVIDVVATKDVAIAPDGTFTANKIQANSGTNFKILRKGAFTIPSGITMSMFVKRGNHDYIIFKAQGDYSFNLSTLQWGGSYSNVGYDDYGNGWIRLYATTTSSSLNYFGIYLSDSNFNQSWTATGNEFVYVWGAQYEVGDYVSSYIKTTGSTVTRLKDECLNGGDSDLFDITEGTFFADVTPYDNEGANTTYILLSDGSTLNRIIFIFYGNLNQVRFFLSSNASGSTVNYLSHYQSISFNQKNKLAFTFKKDELKCYANGSLVHTISSALVPINLESLDFSTSAQNSSFFEGKVHDTRVYDRVLTEAEAIELTTL